MFTVADLVSLMRRTHQTNLINTVFAVIVKCECLTAFGKPVVPLEYIRVDVDFIQSVGGIVYGVPSGASTDSNE